MDYTPGMMELLAGLGHTQCIIHVLEPKEKIQTVSYIDKRGGI